MSDAENHESVSRKLDEVLVKLNEIERAFPDGPEAHRASHEAMIRAANAEERFWMELKLDVAKKGAWGLLLIIVGLLVIATSAKFGIGRPI